jgi:hypothetical protein
MNYEDEAFDELEKKLQKQVAHGVTDGSLWRKRQKPEQRSVSEHLEPVAFIAPNGELRKTAEAKDASEWGAKFKPLYTTPPQRTWVGLTDDEVYKIAFTLEGEHWKKISDAIEAKLKEKNG